MLIMEVSNFYVKKKEKVCHQVSMEILSWYPEWSNITGYSFSLWPLLSTYESILEQEPELHIKCLCEKLTKIYWNAL